MEEELKQLQAEQLLSTVNNIKENIIIINPENFQRNVLLRNGVCLTI